MKKNILCSTATLLFANLSFSQDMITTKTGEDIQAKVIDVTNDEVRYKKFDDQTGPILTISTLNLLIIRYENGSKDIFTAPQNTATPYLILGADSAAKLSQKGRNDAIENYDGRNSGATWVAIMTINPFPVPIIGGAAVAGICSNREPADHNLNYPDSVLMNNPIYNNAYREQAHILKRKKLLKYFAVTAIAETTLAVVSVIAFLAVFF
jgi:hypothetical protein